MWNMQEYKQVTKTRGDHVPDREISLDMRGLVSHSNSQSPKQFDLVIIGGGVGLKLAVWEFGSRGKRIAIIERKYIGGSCPNTAFLLSRWIIYSAQAAKHVGRSEEFRAQARDMAVDMSAVREQNRKMMSVQVEPHPELFGQNDAVLIIDTDRFVGAKTVEVTASDGDNKKLLKGNNVVVIGAGARADLSDISGLSEVCPLMHVKALELDSVTNHLIIFKASYVGLEFAQAPRLFGSKAALIDHDERPLHREVDDHRPGNFCLPSTSTICPSREVAGSNHCSEPTRGQAFPRTLAS